MVIKDMEYKIQGNVVVRPDTNEQQEKQRRYKEQEEQRKRQRDLKRKRAKRKAERRALLNKIIICTFLVGIFIIGLQVYIYGIQANITNLKNEIKVVNEESQSIKVGMLNNNSLHNIKTAAEEKYSMVVGTKKDNVYIDLSKNYFESLDEEDKENENKKEDKSLLDKLMDVLS